MPKEPAHAIRFYMVLVVLLLSVRWIVALLYAKSASNISNRLSERSKAVMLYAPLPQKHTEYIPKYIFQNRLIRKQACDG